MSVFTVLPFEILKVICLVALQYSKNAINTTISDISNITFIRIDFCRVQISFNVLVRTCKTSEFVT